MTTSLRNQLAVLFAAALASLGAGMPYAWWVTARFVPSEERIAGIPISRISPGWKRASVLTEDLLPPEASKPGERPRDHGASFTVDSDLDRDGEQERAVVGVYETASEQGIFLLVLGSAVPGEQRVEALFTLPGGPKFSALSLERGELVWWLCMECGNGIRILAKGPNSYRLGPDVGE